MAPENHLPAGTTMRPPPAFSAAANAAAKAPVHFEPSGFAPKSVMENERPPVNSAGDGSGAPCAGAQNAA